MTPADAGHGRCSRQVCAVADRSMSNLFAGHDSPTGAAGRNAEGPENAAPAVAGSCSRSGTDGCARACRRRALRHEARAPRRTNQPPRPTAVGCAPRAIGCVSSAKSPAQDCPQTAVRCDGAGRSPDADWVGRVLPAPPFPPPPTGLAAGALGTAAATPSRRRDEGRHPGATGFRRPPFLFVRVLQFCSRFSFGSRQAG